MRSTPKLVLLLLLTLACFRSNGQGPWLKKSRSSDDLYRDAKKEIDNKPPHYQRAIDLCHEAIEISPTNLDIHLLLGRAYSLAGKTDSARLELNYVIQKNPRYKDAYIYLVNLEAVACNYLQALEYADMGLKYYPNDRDLLLKKLDIYAKEGDWIESSKLADYLFERYSTDAYIRSVYLDYKLTLARQYAHRGYIEISKQAYEAVLEQDPMNPEALQAVFSLDVRSGNYDGSLGFANRALQSSPNSYELLMKKVSILDAMSRYVEAIGVLGKLMTLYPNRPEVQKLNIYIRMEAGRYYMNTDPYLQFQAVVDKEPGNIEALNYLLNIAYSRGLITDALHWVNLLLVHSPRNMELEQKKVGLFEDLKYYESAYLLADTLYMRDPGGRINSVTNKQHLILLATLAGRDYILHADYDNAEKALNLVLGLDHTNKLAIDYLINAYTQAKRYNEAIRVIDVALNYVTNPDEIEDLKFKKAGTLEAYQDYADAAKISRELLLNAKPESPDYEKYLVSYVEQSLLAGKQSMQYDDYYSTIAALKQVLDLQPHNMDALNYMINIQAADKNYETAISYITSALDFMDSVNNANIETYHDSDNYHDEVYNDLRLKESSIYADEQRYDSAIIISGDLRSEYPYDQRYRNAYVGYLAAAGQHYSINHDADSAIISFDAALAVAPNDTLPLYYMISLLTTRNQRGDFDQALALIQRGRMVYPNNPFFLLKRAQIYEIQRNWEDAWHSADTLVKLTPFDVANVQYSEYLYSHFLKNEVGFIYVHTKIIDSATSNVYGVAAVQYSRKFDRATITARVDYAGRPSGTGYMFEGEGYYNFNPKWYAYGIAGWSPDGKIFPTDHFGLSLFHSFNHGWDAEIGGRTLDADSGKIYSAVASVSREMKEFYVNLRGYLINLTNNSYLQGFPYHEQNYYSAILTSRFYVENRASFFSAIMGYGTAPDDFSLNYELSNILQYPTVSAGMGFSKQFHYKTTVGLFCTWYNMRLATNAYQNQYDVAITVTHRF